MPDIGNSHENKYELLSIRAFRLSDINLIFQCCTITSLMRCTVLLVEKRTTANN